MSNNPERHAGTEALRRNEAIGFEAMRQWGGGAMGRWGVNFRSFQQRDRLVKEIVLRFLDS